MRNASSLSTDSSDFEFDSRSLAEITHNEDGPLSPKLLLNFSRKWDPACEEPSRATGDDLMIINGRTSSPAVIAECDHGEERIEDKAAHSIGDADHIQDPKERMNAKTLLNRRAPFKQLLPTPNYSKLGLESKMTPSSSSSTSSSSTASPSSIPAHPHSSKPSYGYDEMDYVDHFNRSSEVADQKKPTSSRKWAVIKLPSLRKAMPRSRADHRAAEKFLMFRNHETDEPLNCATVRHVINFESQSGSRCSSINHCSSTPSSPFQHIYIDHRRSSKSEPMSPARHWTPPGSPSLTNARGGRRLRGHYNGSTEAMASPAVSTDHHNHTRASRSPHAQHYEQQRARVEELKRRTSLPYRHSLIFGACFFPSHDRFHTNEQIVQQVW